MGRAPCCEKMGLKRGPWTPQEDQLLIAYIQKFGHGNWRALPKLAGLLRCGKSCRLRWTNYLRPDIKRGNFSKEEEDTIFKLHELLGNRWSTIAARLPGRTDNEIKNVWHTHLKKKLKQTQATPDTKSQLIKCEPDLRRESKSKSKSKFRSIPELKSELNNILSPRPSSSEASSGTESGTTVEKVHSNVSIMEEYNISSWETLPQAQADESIWSDVLLPMEQFNMMGDLSTIKTDPDVQFPVSSVSTQSSIVNDAIDYWMGFFNNSEELPDLPEF